MITHFIFMTSSYTLGKRIALDFIVEDEEIKDKLKEYLDRIIKECGKDLSISTHMIQAEDTTWESVCKADHFFKGVAVISSLEKFIKFPVLTQEEKTELMKKIKNGDEEARNEFKNKTKAYKFIKYNYIDS